MKTFWRSCGGGVAVEFALIAPVFVFMLALCLETSRVQLVSMLLERSAYDIAHQLRVAQGEGLQSIASTVLSKHSHGLFDSSAVTVTAWHAEDVQTLAGGGSSGAGGASHIVHLQLNATVSLLASIAPAPLQAQRTIDLYFMNEPDLEER